MKENWQSSYEKNLQKAKNDKVFFAENFLRNPEGKNYILLFQSTRVENLWQ